MNNDIKIAIGRRIKEARKSVGISQQKLGDIFDVEYQAIQNWEKGKSLPVAEKIPLLCETLDISCNDLLNEYKESTPSLLDQLNKAMPSATPRTAKLISECQQLANQRQNDLTEQELAVFMSLLAVIKEKHA